MRTVLACLSLGLVASFVDAAPVKFNDPKPQAYHLTVRASEVDPSAKSYPDIEFDGGMTGKWISERITAVAKSFQHVLEHSAANFYCIQTQGKNSNRSYFVPLKTSQITHVK